MLNTRPFGNEEFNGKERHWFHQEQPYLDFLKHIYDTGVDKADRTGTGARSIFGYMMRFNLQRALPLLTTKSVPRKTVFDELKWFLEGNTNNNRLREINQMHSKMDWTGRSTIWSEWEREGGELGPVYGDQWRNFRGRVLSVKDSATEFETVNDQNILNIVHDDDVLYEGFDQIEEVIHLLKNAPDSRRILVSAWNPTMLKDMALPPCHVLFQFWTRPATLAERDHQLSNTEIKAIARPDLAGLDEHEFYDAYDIPRRVVSCQLYQRSAIERLH